MYEVGRRGWSISFTGTNLLLAHALAVRSSADLPAHDINIPEPLTPEPPVMKIAPSKAARAAAAQQWAAWWRIMWAQNAAHHHAVAAVDAGQRDDWLLDALNRIG